MTNQDSTTQPPQDEDKVLREVEAELQVTIDRIEHAQAEYDALTDEQKGALPESMRQFFGGGDHG